MSASSSVSRKRKTGGGPSSQPQKRRPDAEKVHQMVMRSLSRSESNLSAPQLSNSEGERKRPRRQITVEDFSLLVQHSSQATSDGETTLSFSPSDLHPPNFFNDLPLELFDMVCDQASYRSLMAFGQTSRTMRMLVAHYLARSVYRFTPLLSVAATQLGRDMSLIHSVLRRMERLMESKFRVKIPQDMQELFAQVKRKMSLEDAQKLKQFLDYRDNLLFWTQVKQIRFRPRDSDTFETYEQEFLSLNALRPGFLPNIHKDLNLSKCGLTGIPTDLCDLGRFTVFHSLDFSHNCITEVSPALGNLCSLRTLDLSGNDLRAVPAELGQLVNLRTLRLDQNSLKALPEALGECGSLRTLTAAENNLRYLPEAIGKPYFLSTLDLQKNTLCCLPKSFAKLLSLKELNLSHNDFSDFPGEIVKLRGLELLLISHNQIASLPRGWDSMERLNRLDLCSNQLSTLPRDFCALEMLEELNLGGNPLTLPPEFTQLTRLLNLNLSGCRLEAWPHEVFALFRLVELNLEENAIKKIPEEVYQLSSLVRLNLRRNALTSFPLEMARLPRLKNVHLRGNAGMKSPKKKAK